jgi:hypothetical protein
VNLFNGQYKPRLSFKINPPNIKFMHKKQFMYTCNMNGRTNKLCENKLMFVKLIVTQSNTRYTNFYYYVHGSVNRESISIIDQRNATTYSLLYFCKLLALHVSGGNSTHHQEHI